MEENQKKPSESLVRLTSRILSGEGLRMEETGIQRIQKALDHFFRESIFSKTFGTKVSIAVLRRIVRSFSGSGGLSMKAAQLAIVLDLGLSTEFMNLLGDLPAMTKPLSQRRTQEIIKSAYPNFERDFEFFDWTPFAVTGLSQVHRAKLRSGEDVALKIQHPEIHKIVTSQFQKMGILSVLSQLISGPETDILKEIERLVLSELDYKRELANQKLFAEHFSQVPEILVPKVFENLSRPNILVSEFIQGASFQEFKTTATEETKRKFVLAFELFQSVSLTRLSKFQGDTHPSNFIFQENRLVLLDYGRVIDCNPNRLDVAEPDLKALLQAQPKDRFLFHQFLFTTSLISFKSQMES